ncbi:MAG: hypothetical protein LQ340_002626 [Diploschistes diacapsis]|nr:MAG: hypothetical protein LQ340_002626 [Diploschistes diacapsis]
MLSQPQGQSLYTPDYFSTFGPVTSLQCISRVICCLRSRSQSPRKSPSASETTYPDLKVTLQTNLCTYKAEQRTNLTRDLQRCHKIITTLSSISPRVRPQPPTLEVLHVVSAGTDHVDDLPIYRHTSVPITTVSGVPRPQYQRIMDHHYLPRRLVPLLARGEIIVPTDLIEAPLRQDDDESPTPGKGLRGVGALRSMLRRRNRCPGGDPLWAAAQLHHGAAHERHQCEVYHAGR